MLSTVGRAALRRIGGGVSTSTNRTLQSLWGLQRVDSARCTDPPSQQLSWARLARFYATATETDAKPKTPRKKRTTTAKTSTAEGKKTTKTATKKAVPKAKKAVVKKKKVAPKKKPAKPKKQPTEEEKLKADIKLLKEKALLKEEPPRPVVTAYGIVVSDLTKGQQGGLKGPEAKERYRSASPAEMEEYNRRAREKKEAMRVTYTTWVESHAPLVISHANSARQSLARKLKSKQRDQLIPDERIPKRPVGAYVLFNKDRHDSGDLKHIDSFTARNKLVVDEWNALRESEKQPYLDKAAADLLRYQQEVKTVFGRDIRPKSKAT